jgi:hypothetical protein
MRMILTPTTPEEARVADDRSEPLRLLEKQLDRQGSEIDELRRGQEEVPGLRKEVAMLKETVRSNTQVMYVLVGLIISSGFAGALLKGVI